MTSKIFAAAFALIAVINQVNAGCLLPRQKCNCAQKLISNNAYSGNYGASPANNAYSSNYGASSANNAYSSNYGASPAASYTFASAPAAGSYSYYGSSPAASYTYATGSAPAPAAPQAVPCPQEQTIVKELPNVDVSVKVPEKMVTGSIMHVQKYTVTPKLVDCVPSAPGAPTVLHASGFSQSGPALYRSAASYAPAVGSYGSAVGSWAPAGAPVISEASELPTGHGSKSAAIQELLTTIQNAAHKAGVKTDCVC